MCVENPLLRVQEVSRTFHVRTGVLADNAQLVAVDSVSLELKAGETLGLVGESGCGKSTLGRMIVGLLPPSSGHIFVHNKALYGTKKHGAWRNELAGRVQMVFQDPFSSLNPRLRVKHSIAEPLIVQGVAKQEIQQRVSQMLHLVGLTPAQGQLYPHEFSGGQRQRVALARALITHPKVLVCDEPVSALDASVQAQVLNLLRDMQERFHLASLFISHDLAVVGFMCSRIVVMYLGRMVESAPKNVLFQKAAHPYSQALLAAIPSLDPAAQEIFAPLGGELPSPLNPPAGCAFHPRCPKVMDICRHKAPTWVNLTGDDQEQHGVCCHLYGSI